MWIGCQDLDAPHSELYLVEQPDTHLEILFGGDNRFLSCMKPLA